MQQLYGEWIKPGHNGSRDFHLNMNDDWFTLQEELKRAERWERFERQQTPDAQ